MAKNGFLKTKRTGSEIAFTTSPFGKENRGKFIGTLI